MKKIIQINKLIIAAVIITGGLVLSSCGSNSPSGNGGSGGAVFTGINPLTIDNAGVVPIIGDNSTTSVIYVHNNTDQLISGIRYVAQLNTGGSNFLDSKSTSLCAIIPARHSCPLSFTTPVLSKATAQGAALITASYDYEKKPHQFNQILNFDRVDDTAVKGAVFNSGIALASAGNEMVYGTVYIYGSGQNKVYTVNSITSNKGGVQIIQGNITGKQIQSNYVSAVEVSAPTNLLSSSRQKLATTKSTQKADDGFNAILTANSSLGSTSYSSISNVSVAPVAAGAILTVGDVTIIDSSVANPTGTLYITNAGNQTATLGTIAFPAGVTNIGAGSCGSLLVAGAGCSIVFSVPQSGGNGNITINYTGGSTSAVITTVTWYNSKSEALLQMLASSNPLTFSATLGGTTVVRVSNIGGYNLSSVTTTQTTTSGSATAVATTPVCINSAGGATGTNMPVGGSCTYSVTVSDSTAEIGKNINLGISGTYNNGSSQIYSRLLALAYTSNQYQALLSVPATTMASIVGNNTESSTATITVSNNGEAPAVITNSALSSQPAYLTVSNNGCSGATVNSGASCIVTLRVGPTTAQSEITGNATYGVTYSGGQTAAGTVASNDVSYSVQANSQNITMETVTASAGISGDGASATSYQISGALALPKIILTYRNSGTNPVQISGIHNTNSPISWEIDPATSSCYNSGSLPSATIASGAFCTIVFNNVLAQYAKAVSNGVGATYTENLIVPTLIFQDMVATTTQFQVTPAAPAPISGDTIYVQGNQATLANNLTQGANTIIVSQSLANATAYPTLTVVSRMENYFTANPTLNACTANAESGVMIQTCSLISDGSGVANASVVYDKNSTYIGASLHVLFDLTSSGVVVSFTPLSAQLILN